MALNLENDLVLVNSSTFGVTINEELIFEEYEMKNFCDPLLKKKKKFSPTLPIFYVLFSSPELLISQVQTIMFLRKKI